jgi:hypothetical protein
MFVWSENITQGEDLSTQGVTLLLGLLM